MVNVNKLKGKIVEKGFTIETLADKLGLDKTTLYRRLSKNGETFLIREANIICKELNLTSEEAISIFFNPNVAQNANSKEEAACRDAG